MTPREAWDAAIEAAAMMARYACLVPPDGGSPSPEEVAVADTAEARIRSLTPPPEIEVVSEAADENGSASPDAVAWGSGYVAGYRDAARTAKCTAPPPDEADTEAVARAVEDRLRRVYVVRADARQISMGLSYVEAETKDLARVTTAAAIAALRERGWVPAAREEPTTFGECPPGLFLSGGTLCFKSEYHTKVNQPDAYVVSSGEYFWGGTDNPEVRLSLVVIPLSAAPEPPA